ETGWLPRWPTGMRAQKTARDGRVFKLDSQFGNENYRGRVRVLADFRGSTNTERKERAMFSRSSGYAIQALTYLASQPSGRLVGAREIATSLDIPMPFLWKILRKLSHQKLVRSFKGVRGGYELARPASSIRMSEILQVGNDNGAGGQCVLGLTL